MAWQQETLKKVYKARRHSNELYRRLCDVKIMLYEFEEYEDEHAAVVEHMSTIHRLLAELFALERKLHAAMTHTKED